LEIVIDSQMEHGDQIRLRKYCMLNEDNNFNVYALG